MPLDQIFGVRTGPFCFYRENALILQIYPPHFLDIKQMNYVHSNDEKKCLFQFCEFLGPGLEVLALGCSSNDFMEWF